MGRPRKKRQVYDFPNKPSLDPSAVNEFVASGDTAERIKNDATRKQQVAEAVREIPEIFEPEQIEGLLDVYSVILAFLFSVVLKAPFDIIHPAIKMDNDFKKSVSKPLAKLLSKLAPVEWAGMKDEIQVGIAVIIYSAASFGHAKSAVAKWKEESAQRQNPRNRVTQTPKVVTVEPVESVL